MNEYLSKLCVWFIKNKLTINIKKTEFLTFGCYADSVPDVINIRANKFDVTRKESLKYLSVMIDYNLKWYLHIHGEKFYSKNY